MANDDPKQVFFSRGIEVKSGKIPGTDEIGIGDDLTFSSRDDLTLEMIWI